MECPEMVTECPEMVIECQTEVIESWSGHAEQHAGGCAGLPALLRPPGGRAMCHLCVLPFCDWFPAGGMVEGPHTCGGDVVRRVH
eukprot:1138274-Pelagomonas_calceolata.AAC.2